MPALPRRIECFDISTIQGRETVASMVVCEDGRMRRGEYRKYRIRGSGPGFRSSGLARSLPIPIPSVPDPGSRIPVPDDFAAMYEVVSRRYRKLLADGGPFPDLIVIDGNPLVDMAALQYVVVVMKEGVQYKGPGTDSAVTRLMSGTK